MTRRRVASRLGWLLLQLFVVFVGVFAAFLLDDYRERRRAEHRAEQILLLLQPQFAGTASDLARTDSLLTARVDTFFARYERGEMPPVGEYGFFIRFGVGTWQAILEAGGLEILDVETIDTVSELYLSVEAVVSEMEGYERLSRTMILPRLEEGQAAFYDPETQRLRPTYQWYSEALRFTADRMGNLSSMADSALAAIDAELERLGVEAPAEP